jgi:hypothetical protein
LANSVDKYIITADGVTKVDYQLLYSDLAEIRGFQSEKIRKNLFDRVNDILEVRNNLKESPERVPF